MSLLKNAMEDFTQVEKTTVGDGRGGMVTTWVDGATIRAAIVHDRSVQSRIAEAQGVTTTYTITTTKAINLQYHDVLRRAADGRVFRVTSNGNDNKTPDSAGLDMRQVSAEEWSIPG